VLGVAAGAWCLSGHGLVLRRAAARGLGEWRPVWRVEAPPLRQRARCRDGAHGARRGTG